MEGANSEKQETMEEPVQDTSSLDEWTIINDEREKLMASPVVPVPEEITGTTDEHHDADKETRTVEEAREVIEEVDPASLDAASTPQDDDSDGISVISESDKEEAEVNREIIAKIEKTTDEVNPGLSVYFMHFIVACCLAALVGFGIGCVVGNSKTAQQSTPSADIRMTNHRAIHPTAESLRNEIFDDTSVTIDAAEYSPEALEEPMKQLAEVLQQIKRVNDLNNDIKKLNKDPTLEDSLHKVRFSLDVLCSLIDKKHIANYGNICTKSSALFHVFELKDTIEYIVNELGDVEDVSTKQFINNMSSKIENFASGFVDGLSNLAGQFLTKIDQKIAKMRGKLYQRLCLIRNTYSNEAKIQEILDKRRISIDNCEKIQFNNQKPERQENQEKKTHQREKRHDDAEHLDAVYSDETMEIESLEEMSAEQPHSNKNKRKGQKPEDFKAKKTYKAHKENSSENKDKPLRASEHSHQKYDSKSNKKYNNNQYNNKNDREFRDYSKKSDEKLEVESGEQSKEMNQNYNKENKENKQQIKNEEKFKRKFNKRRFSWEDSSTEDLDADSAESEKKQRNSHKSSKKYGSPKGEPKENFVEKNQGNYNENHNDNHACHSKKCPRDNDEKSNGKNGKNGHWQFERAQGRNKYRSSEEEGVWYDDRARARERSRLGF